MLSNLKRTKGTPAVIHVVTNHFITELVKTDWPLNKTEENMIKCLLTPQPYLSEQPIYSLIYAKMYAYSFSLVLLPIYFLNQGTKEISWKKKRMDSFATTWEGGHVVWQTNKMFFKSEFAWKKSWVLREGESLPFQVNQNGRYVVGSDPAKAGKKLHAIINVCIYNWLSLLLIPNKVFKKITLVTRTNCKLKIIVPTMKHTPWW